MTNLKHLLSFAALAGIALAQPLSADIVLIGSNPPEKSINDGDFDWNPYAPWRQYLQSPAWTTEVVSGWKAGLSAGYMSGGGAKEVHFESIELTENSAYPEMVAGDILSWRFAAKAQYPCNPRVSLALLFGERARMLVNEQAVPQGKAEVKIFEGTYTITPTDAEAGTLRVRLSAFEDHGINVYFDYVDLKVLRPETAGPRKLNAEPNKAGMQLSWSAQSDDERFSIYRSSKGRGGFEKIAGDIAGGSYTDRSIINGQTKYYTVKRTHLTPSTASPTVVARKVDNIPPKAPPNLVASGEDFVIKLEWKKLDQDTAYYSIFRGDADGNNMERIAQKVTATKFQDDLPRKGESNSYRVQAIDFSGNKSELSELATATVETVPGASFSDLILPMPIHKELRSDLWGVETVLPRDPDNGVEDGEWSYWGGKVVHDSSDGKYHILIVRWPEGDRKGHWAWPYSTVAHAISDNPTGPYEIVEDIAYDYKEGLGHNANIITLNDRRYALYSLINWKPIVFTADTMSGPWELEGEIKINLDNPIVDRAREYRYRNNLSGIHREDGSFLFVTKAGAMMESSQGILGPYEVLNRAVNHNPTIPRPYSNSNYEDPTIWYDGVQYHMLINAFLEYRAIYLRSPDGVNWKYETGFAYTPLSTTYNDGTRTHWYKLERPNVLQDEYGRATHLSLAAVDAPKREDYGNDDHSSKHLILPLNVYKRIDMLNTEPVGEITSEIKLLIYAETGFDPEKALDLESLRFGGAEAVNFGRGAKIQSTEKHEDGLILVFDGTGNEITNSNFVGKLIGKTKSDDIIVGYSKLVAE
ncbi:MAG: hypothetical protein AAFX93_16655 [Verrucomicrobiota bacterium]